MRERTPRIGPWTTATIVEVSHPALGFARIRLDVADRVEHVPGQHYVVRLRAPDDYTAQRSYSIASDPEDPVVELLVERFDDGEVSSFLADIADVGDLLEVRGPLGGWFVWDATVPAVALGGGTGVVPLVSMLRFARRSEVAHELRLAVSARTWATLPYADELDDAGALVAITREHHADRRAGRLTRDEVAELVHGAGRAYVCGSATFSAAATGLLLDAGMPENAIRIEQFGPSGGD